MEFCYSCMNQLQTNVPVCPYCKSKIPYIPMRPEDLKPGSRLDNGRFVIGRALGHGGYGITYIAYDTKMLVKRTIKEYYPKGAVRNEQMELTYPESEEAHISRTREHFLHEARMMIRASESHVPGVVQGIDTFNENGTSYILMEYLEGRTMDDHMHQVLYGPFPWKEAVRYAAEALASLQKLHEKNILHRDISCNNIFLCNDKSVRLIDFGSAEPLDKAQNEPASLWRSRKPAYTPKEQSENKKQGTYSDVYAMAVTLFKMISGKTDPNLNGRPLPSVRAAANNQEIPQALDHILAEATAEDPEKRIQTAEEFRRKLLPLIGEKDTKKGRGGLLAVLAVLVVLLGAAVAAIILGANSGQGWQSIGLDSAERRITVPYGETFELSGSAEPGQGVSLFLLADGSSVEEEIASATADDKGQWQLVYNTADSGVTLNELKGYAAAVGYSDSETHTNRSDQIRLTIDRRLAALSIGVKDNYGSNVKDAEAGEVITVYGGGQAGGAVAVSAQNESGSTVAGPWNAVWQDGEWTCEIDTAELSPSTGTLSRKYRITACYDGFPDTQTDRDHSVSLTVKRRLAPITVSFEEGQEEIVVTGADESVTVHGTAEANEGLMLHVGSETYNVTADGDGEWKRTLPQMNKLADYRYDERVPLQVYVNYSIDAGNVSQPITLVSNVRRKTIPVIEHFPDTPVQENGEIVLSGTAEPGATLEIRVRLNGRGDNLTPGLTVTTDEETGSWKTTFGTDRIGGEHREGTMAYYRVTACQKKGKEEISSGEVPVNVDYPMVYDIPVMKFTDRDETEIRADYTASVAIEGTAKPGQHLRLHVNGSAAQADILVGQDGRWSHTIESLGNWKPELDKETELLLQIRYADNEIRAEHGLKVFVTNERFTALTIQLDDSVIGPGGSTKLTVEGAASKEVDLVRNEYVWDTVTLDSDGRYTRELTAADIPSGMKQAGILARYKAQTETQSGKVTLGVDRTADPVDVSGTVTEESSRIAGKAEPGAELALRIDGKEAGRQTAGENGEFSFENLTLDAGSEIAITETDPYGNSTTWQTTAAEVPRDAIVPEEYTSGQFITYGPNNCMLQLSGTAAKNKAILITLKYPSAAETEPVRVTAGEDGQWTAETELPLQDKLQATVTLAYEDGRGRNIEFYTVCDNKIEQPLVQPEVIYERSTESVTCMVSESNCTIGWQLVSADGTVKREKTDIPVSNMQQEIRLPDGRAAGDRFMVTVTDQYGNKNSTSLEVLEQRDEVKGKIYSVLCGKDKKEIRDGDSFTDSLFVEAYAAAGRDAAAGSAVLKLVQKGNVCASARLKQVTGDETQRIVNILDAEKADDFWGDKKKELTVSQLEYGECELQLTSGDIILESWTLTYGTEKKDVQELMHTEDVWNGYDAGVDIPTASYSPRTIYLTGWLYFFDEETVNMNSGILTLYEDSNRENKVTEISLKQLENMERYPATTQCGEEARKLDKEAYAKAGRIMVFQCGEKIDSGKYWAVLYTGGTEFGPFELSIDNNSKPIRMKDFKDSLQWKTEE